MARRKALLTETEAEFCRKAAEAAFRNPFSEEFRAVVAGTIGGCERLVDSLEKRGSAELRHYAGEQRETMRLTFLFDAYERFRAALDALVVEQVAAPEPVGVPFARELLALLARRGVGEEEALRVMAIFYQIRRAHHFIEEGLIGASEAMRKFRHHLWENVFTHDIRHYERGLWDRMEDFSTLLLGETGTGKGTAAAAIGRSAFIPFDARKQRFAESFMRGFVSINLSQFPETLIESELFGHRKGAFTGAVEAHEGIFARCSPHGAIFLDEIGEVSVPVQIKLLRVLQERVFTPVGSHDGLRFRGRVIAATNRPLAALRGDGGFRDDFYYRLCSDTIVVPPLRQRLREEPAELEALLEHILLRVADGAAASLRGVVREGLRDLLRRDYAWPGNVRELEQAVRRILLTRRYAGEEPVAAMDAEAGLAARIREGTIDAESLLAEYCRLLHGRSRNLEEVARRTKLDRRTVKRYLGLGEVSEG